MNMSIQPQECTAPRQSHSTAATGDTLSCILPADRLQKRRHSSVHSHPSSGMIRVLLAPQAEAAEAKAAELQSELGQAYKSKSQLSEDLLKAR